MDEVGRESVWGGSEQLDFELDDADASDFGEKGW